MFSPARVPLGEVSHVPGVPVPVGGRGVPSDAPGLGSEFGADNFQAWA
jgi:hypothetical protein